MPPIAASASALVLYLPIIFMPSDILATTEHLPVAVLRPTNQGPETGWTKADVAKRPTKTAATAYFGAEPHSLRDRFCST